MMQQLAAPLVVSSFNVFLPSSLIDELGLATAGWVVFWMLANFFRWRSTALAPVSAAMGVNLGSTAKTFAVTIVKDGLYQRDVFACGRARWLTHFVIFWGFVLLMVTTTLSWITNPGILPVPITDPVRILGNLGGLLLLAGLIIAVGRRLLVSNIRSTSEFSDALFLFLICATAVTGFGVEFANELNAYSVTYGFYFIHLAFVGLLLGTAPFTKFVHAIGRFFFLFIDKLSPKA